MWRIETVEQDLDSWAAKLVDFAFDPSGELTYFPLWNYHKAMRNAVPTLRRRTIRSLLRDDHVVPATVIARALIETIDIGCLFLSDMERLIAAGDRDRLDNRVKRFYTGIKGSGVEPVHVLDGIRHLEELDKHTPKYLDYNIRRLHAIYRNDQKGQTRYTGSI